MSHGKLAPCTDSVKNSCQKHLPRPSPEREVITSHEDSSPVYGSPLRSGELLLQECPSQYQGGGELGGTAATCTNKQLEAAEAGGCYDTMSMEFCGRALKEDIHNGAFSCLGVTSAAAIRVAPEIISSVSTIEGSNAQACKPTLAPFRPEPAQLQFMQSALVSDACGLSSADQHAHDQPSTCNPARCSVREDEIEAATEGGAPECTGHLRDPRPVLVKPVLAKRPKVCGTSREAPTGPTLTFSRLSDGQRSDKDPEFEGGNEAAEKVSCCACQCLQARAC